jgi:hypothetical protein
MMDQPPDVRIERTTLTKTLKWPLGLLAAFLLTWSLWPSEQAVARVKRDRIGQTRAEVEIVMGSPRMSSSIAGKTVLCFGPKSLTELNVRAYLAERFGFAGLLEQFPVGIEFGSDNRVETIRVLPPSI